MAGTRASFFTDLVPQLGWIYQIFVSGLSVLGVNRAPAFLPNALFVAQWKEAWLRTSRAQHQDCCVLKAQTWNIAHLITSSTFFLVKSSHRSVQIPGLGTTGYTASRHVSWLQSNILPDKEVL